MTLPDANERRQIAINIGPWLLGTIRTVTVAGIVGLFSLFWTAYGTLGDHTNVMKQLVEGQAEAKAKIESMEEKLIQRVQRDEDKYDARYSLIQEAVAEIKSSIAVMRQRESDDMGLPPDFRPARPTGH